jgi:hypothetical protein
MLNGYCVDCVWPVFRWHQMLKRDTNYSYLICDGNQAFMLEASNAQARLIT